MLKTAARFLKVLNSQGDPSQISLAFSFSMVVGFTPMFSLHNLLAVFLVLILRVNLSAFFLGFLFFSGLAFVLDPFFGWVGLHVLTAEVFTDLWTVLYNTPVGRLSKFYNSIVMGSLLVSLIFFIPLYFISNGLILRYRQHVLQWVRKTRLMQAIQATKFYRIYTSFSTIRGSE